MTPKTVPTILATGLLGVLVLSLSTEAVSRANLTTLRQVQIINRHGAKNIDQTYPVDPYKDESYWPPGYSQLTNTGKLQGYQLGKELRERYGGFVKETYELKDIYVVASDLTRTMQTAESIMAGFYLPNEIGDVNLTDEAIVNNQIEVPLPWKSVPIHTIPLEYDNLIRQRSENCPRYFQLLQQQEAEAPNSHPGQIRLFEYINNNTGLNISTAVSYNLYLDTFVIERDRNFTLPSWTEVVFNSTSDVTSYFPLLTKTFQMKRFRAGPLLGRIRKNIMFNSTAVMPSEFDRARSGKKKIYFFSGHDTTLGSILTTLGIYNYIRPPYTAAILLELHQNISSGEYYVEFYYRNETDKDPYKLDILSCDQPCMLSTFLGIIDPYIPSAWSQECRLIEDSSGISAIWIAIIILVVWIALFISLQCWVRSGGKGCFTGRKKHRNSYDLLR